VDKRHLKEMEDLLRRADEDYGQQCRSEDEGKQFVAQEQLKELANVRALLYLSYVAASAVTHLPLMH